MTPLKIGFSFSRICQVILIHLQKNPCKLISRITTWKASLPLLGSSCHHNWSWGCRQRKRNSCVTLWSLMKIILRRPNSIIKSLSLMTSMSSSKRSRRSMRPTMAQTENLEIKRRKVWDPKEMTRITIPGRQCRWDMSMILINLATQLNRKTGNHNSRPK